MAEDRARTERLIEVLRDVVVIDLRLGLERDQVQPDTPLFGTGLGLDSVDAVDLAVGVETRTGVKIPDTWHGRAALRSINHLVAFIESQDGDVLPEEIQQAARAAVASGVIEPMRGFRGES